MQYTNTGKGLTNNILNLMREFGTLKRSQLVDFFSDSFDKDIISFYIDHLVAQIKLDELEGTDTVSYHNYFKEKPDATERKIDAFEIVRSLGSKKIKEIWRIDYPGQIMFMDDEGTLFDISVIRNEAEGRLAQRYMNQGRLENVEDPVNHIALVPSEKTGYELKDCGFDFFCIVDRNSGEVTYYEY